MIEYTFTGFVIDSLVYEIELSEAVPERWAVNRKPQKIKCMIIDSAINYVLEGNGPSLKEPTLLFEDMESAELECKLRNRETIVPELKIAKG